jgi:hypothetical protein
MVNFFRVKAAEAMKAGMKFAESGNFDEGRLVIDTVIGEL